MHCRKGSVKGSQQYCSTRPQRYHLLCVNRTLQLGHILRLANGAQEDGLELVHARIREEQCGVIVRDDRRRGDCAEEAKMVSALSLKVSYRTVVYRECNEGIAAYLCPFCGGRMQLKHVRMPSLFSSFLFFGQGDRAWDGGMRGSDQSCGGGMFAYQHCDPALQKSPRRSCGPGHQSTENRKPWRAVLKTEKVTTKRKRVVEKTRNRL